jgi:hypothetical protein
LYDHTVVDTFVRFVAAHRLICKTGPLHFPHKQAAGGDMGRRAFHLPGADKQAPPPFLRARGWHVERMLADAYQNGIPDLFCYNKKWGMRWGEVDLPPFFVLGVM